jgi:mannitol 2-dehydrogenase
MARYTHDLMALDPAAVGWGSVGAGFRPADTPLLATQDGLYTLVEREGDIEQRVMVSSLCDC